MTATLRRAYEAFNRGDFDEIPQFADPGIEFHRPAPQSTLRGIEAIRAWMEPDAFEQQKVEPLEFTVNRDKVLVHQRTRARGAGSGIEVEADGYSVWTFNEAGLMTRMEFFFHYQRDEALKAAGLRED